MGRNGKAKMAIIDFYHRELLSEGAVSLSSMKVFLKEAGLAKSHWSYNKRFFDMADNGYLVLLEEPNKPTKAPCEHKGYQHPKREALVNLYFELTGGAVALIYMCDFRDAMRARGLHYKNLYDNRHLFVITGHKIAIKEDYRCVPNIQF